MSLSIPRGPIAFISYVSENATVADIIAKVLQANGIQVWLDKNQLKGGQSWPDEIKKAIQSGSFFIPLFSKEWEKREKTIANDELLIAIDESRLRPYNSKWIVPVILNECNVPEIPIGNNRTLHSIQFIDFTKGSRDTAFLALLAALQIANPILLPETYDEINAKGGWPFEIRIIRDDQFVNKIPVGVYMDSNFLSENAGSNTVLSHNQSGNHKIHCLVCCHSPYILQTRSFEQGIYYRGISNLIEYEFLPGNKYEFHINASKTAVLKIYSPYAEMFRVFKGSLFDNYVDIDDQRTWPNISLKIFRI